jgi:hypothetical protein
MHKWNFKIKVRALDWMLKKIMPSFIIMAIVSCTSEADDKSKSNNPIPSNMNSPAETRSDEKVKENSMKVDKKIPSNGLINPITYFANRSKSVIEHSYYADASTLNAIAYFKSINLIKYSTEAFSAETVRFKNRAENVYVMVFPVKNNRVYIVMSRDEYVDEIDV